MAQNPYLQNLLGINQGGTGLYGYNYTLPTYNNLLSQGLTEAQIAQYDPNFSTFNQFPYKAKPNPNANFAQYEVVPQVAGQVPVEEETEVNIDYGNQNTNNNNSFQDITTQRYGTIRDNNPEVLNLSNVPLNDMSESELMDYGLRKGYIGEDGILLGPQQTTMGKMGLYGNILKAPAQIMNDKKYEMFIKALEKKNMYLGNYGGDRNKAKFAMFSPSYKEALAKANFYNDKLGNIGTNTNIRIPGTAKSVAGIINQYVPTGVGADKSKNNVQYHTSTGGYYTGDGKFVTGYGQTVAFGSLQDAVDTIFAAAQSGNVSTVPDKFLTPEYIKTIKKLIKRGDFTQDQGDDIITAINTINTIDKPKKEIKKKKSGNKPYYNQGTDGGGAYNTSSSSSSSYSYSNPYNNPSTENVGTSGMTYGNVSSR